MDNTEMVQIINHMHVSRFEEIYIKLTYAYMKRREDEGLTVDLSLSINNNYLLSMYIL